MSEEWLVMQWVTLVLQWLGSSLDDHVACGPCQHVSCGRLSFLESFSGDPEARRCWHHVSPLRILNAFSLAEWVWVTMHFSKDIADFSGSSGPQVVRWAAIQMLMLEDTANGTSQPCSSWAWKAFGNWMNVRECVNYRNKVTCCLWFRLLLCGLGLL